MRKRKKSILKISHVLARMWRKGNPCVLLMGMQSGVATLEASRSFLKKLKMDLPYDPAVPFLRIYPKKPKH